MSVFLGYVLKYLRVKVTNTLECSSVQKKSLKRETQAIVAKYQKLVNLH